MIVPVMDTSVTGPISFAPLLTPLHSLCSSDAIWWQWTWLTLAEVTNWCNQAPSHYLNQHWLIISTVLFVFILPSISYPASIATLTQRRHWSASSRSAADVAPTLVFRRLRCYGMLAFCRLAYRSLPMFCVWTSVVGIKCFSNKCCRSTRLSIHQLHI